MTLDDIEKLARDYRDSCTDLGNTGCIGDDLARALLAVMPVVKAAEALKDAERAWLADPSKPVRRHGIDEKDKALQAAIDTMRAEIGGEG